MEETFHFLFPCKPRTTSNRRLRYEKFRFMAGKSNRPFSKYKNSTFWNKAKCKPLLVKVSFVYKRIKHNFHINSLKWDRKKINVNKGQNTDRSVCKQTSRFDTKSFQYKSFGYKLLKQWNFTNILFTSSLVCEWTRKTFKVNIFVL